MIYPKFVLKLLVNMLFFSYLPKRLSFGSISFWYVKRLQIWVRWIPYLREFSMVPLKVCSKSECHFRQISKHCNFAPFHIIIIFQLNRPEYHKVPFVHFIDQLTSIANLFVTREFIHRIWLKIPLKLLLHRVLVLFMFLISRYINKPWSIVP